MSRGQHALIVFVVLTLSAAARVYQLGLSSYWIDEMVSLHFAKFPALHSVFWDNNPPTYHLLLKLWVRLFGDAEAVTRTLSVFFSVGATALLMRIGYEARGWIGAAICGLLHATSFMSIAYAQETRMYAMFEFFAALNLLFFARVFREGRNAGAFVASSIVLAFVHYLAFIPVFVSSALLLWHRPVNKERWAALAGSLGGVALLEGAFYLNFFKWEGLQWQNMKFALEPQSHWPVELAGELMNRSWTYGVAFVALLGVAFCFAKRERRKEYVAMAVLVLAPVFLLWLGAFVTKRSVFLPRYFIYVVPPMLVLSGLCGVDLLRGGRRTRLLAYGVFVSLVVGTAWNLPSLYKPYKEPWRDVAETIGKYPNTLVLTTRTVAIATPYFERAGIEVRKWDPGNMEELARLLRELGSRKRVWVVENFWGGYPYMENLKEQLTQMGLEVSELSMRTEYSAPVLVMMIEDTRP